jgi:hypothetical protein
MGWLCKIFAFTGLIKCGGCQGAVTAEEKHQIICSACKFKFAYRSKEQCPKCKTAIADMVNPLRLFYTYYHCARSCNPACIERGIERKELENQVIRLLERLHLPDFHRHWFNTCFARMRENKDLSEPLPILIQSFFGNTPSIQREITMSVFSTLIFKDRKLNVTLKSPFSFKNESEAAIPFDQESFVEKPLQEKMA